MELFSYILVLGVLLAILYLLQRALIGNVSLLGAFGVYFYFLFFLPGIILHELAHLFMSLILGVPAGQLALFPRKRDGEENNSNYWILGSVMTAETDVLRTGLIGFAPMFLGVFCMVLIVNLGLGIKEIKDIANLTLTWPMVLFVYLLMAITNTMFLSKEDRSGVWILPGLLLILMLVFKFFGLQFSQELLGFFTKVILILNFCFAVACLINFVMLFPLSLIRSIALKIY